MRAATAREGAPRARGIVPRLARLALVAGLALAGAPAHAAVCGDGIFDAGEQCDDGNLFGGDCCSSSCTTLACNPTSSSAVSWQELGPFDVGGRVTALAVDPQNGDRWLIGTPAAGIWRTEDAGASWVAIAPWLDVAPVSALAISPVSSSRYVVGTGILLDSGSVGDALGTMQTQDAGAGWSFEAQPAHTAYVGGILLFADDANRVVLATERGLLLSTNGGTSFFETKTGDAFLSVLRDPFDGNRLVASGRIGFYESLDRGATWSFIAPWPGVNSFEGVGAARTVLVISHQTPGLMRAVVQDLLTFVETERIILLESVDDGRTWAELPVPAGICATNQTDRCGFATSLALDPANDARMLLGGDRLYRSVDGGQSWSVLDASVRGVHEIVPAAGGPVVAGRFGVARLSTAWDAPVLRHAGLPISGIVALDVRRTGTRGVLAATSDGGTLLGEGTPLSFDVVFGANEPASEARFDPFQPGTIYAGLRRGDFSRSTDGGASFSIVTSGLDPLQIAADVAPLAVNPLVAGELYTGRLQVFRSTNRGDLWSAFRPVGAPEVGVIVPSPIISNRIFFAAAKGGTLYEAEGIHTDTTVLDAALDAKITAIYPDPSAENRVYVPITNTATLTGALWRTEDFGAHWEDRSFGKLPPIQDVVKDAFGALYVATSDGVWRSASEGLVWSRFDAGMPTRRVTRLARDGDALIAGTLGRGLFELTSRPLVAIDTIPADQWLIVDGVLHRGPVFADWAPGSQHVISPYLLQTEDTRQRFVGWTQGGAQTQSFTATGANEWPTAVIEVMHRLRTSVSPPGSGTIVIDPASPDGFHPFQSFVQLVAIPAPDHRISGWTGDLASVDRLLAGAQMTGPRSVTAHFEPLQVRFATDPPGLAISIDGQSVTTPQVFQWAKGSLHPLDPPASIDLNPADPMELVFDHWSDHLPRAHSFEMRSETYTADVTAHYLPVVRTTTLPAGGTQRLSTLGQQHARRELSLSIVPGAGTSLPATLQFLRSSANGSVISELALPRGVAVTRVNTWVEGRELVEGGGLTGDGRIRRTRIVLHNPGTLTSTIDVVLHATDGSAIAGKNGVLAVPPGGQRIVMLDELIGLPKTYAGALTIDASAPLLMKVLGVTENLRELDFTDPILFHSFDESDAGMPPETTAQVLLATPGTAHVIALLNPEPVPCAGTLYFRDRDGVALTAEVDGAPATSAAFSFAAGEHRVYRVRFPAGVPGSETVRHARIELATTFGPVPRLRTLSEQEIGTTRYGTSVLPSALPPARSLTSFRLPADLSRRDTGVVLVNRGGTDVGAILTLRDPSGAVVRTHGVALYAGTQRLVLASEITPAPPAGFAGSLMVQTSGPVEAVGFTRLVNGRGESVLAGAPALDPPGDAPDTKHHFAYAVDGDTWSSEIWLLSDESSPRTASLSLHDAKGVERFLPMEAPLQ